MQARGAGRFPPRGDLRRDGSAVRADDPVRLFELLEPVLQLFLTCAGRRRTRARGRRRIPDAESIERFRDRAVWAGAAGAHRLFRFGLKRSIVYGIGFVLLTARLAYARPPELVILNDRSSVSKRSIHLARSLLGLTREPFGF